MTVQCIDCERFSFRGANLARFGFGICAVKTAAENHSATYPRHCEKFAPTDADKAKARREWINKKDGAQRAEASQ